MANRAPESHWRDEVQRLLSAGDYAPAHARCMVVLQRAPQESEPLFYLAQIAFDHGNLEKAADIVRRAIAMQPEDARYHALLARCLVFRRDLNGALAAAERAIALGARDGWTADTIGVTLSYVGLYGRALEFFEAAVKAAPDKADFLYNLGVARQFLGDLTGAARAFRAELALRPGARRPLTALVQLSRQTAEGNFAAELEALFDKTEDADGRLQIGHALAKTYEDIGDHARAFAWLERGKADKKALIGPTIPHVTAYFEAVRKAFLETPAQTGARSAAPIIIAGMPRTGTTLLDRVLSSHPAVESLGELPHFAWLLAAASGKSDEARDVDMIAAAARAEFAKIGENYLDAANRLRGGADRFTDKMPGNFVYAGFIHRALPNARIICLRRKPMDAVLSNYRQIFSAAAAHYWYTLDLEDIARYYLLFDQMVAFWREHLPADRFIEVSYEDIVLDLESTTRRVLSSCGLEWDARCLSFHENETPVATASSVQVRQPLYATSIGRWRRHGEAMAPAAAIFKAAGLSIE